MQFPFQTVFQQEGNWYVLDQEFPWDVVMVKQDLCSLMEERDVPVMFCDTCEANMILLALGEEEEEFLFPLSGLYHQGRRIIFIFRWEQYELLLETLLHEFRHDMQYEDEDLRKRFHEERCLTYDERWIEKDASAFAKEKMKQYFQRRYN
ncbi:DUF3920 family protein [Microbacteriaceae bacterium 4G12]